MEGPLPLPLVNPDARGFELGKEYHQIQKMRSNAKNMLLYKRYAPIQKTCSSTKDGFKYKRYPRLQNICIYKLTRKSHICLFLLDDHGNAFGLIPAIIVWKDDHFIQRSFQINSMAPINRKISRIAVVRLLMTNNS